ncbi:oxidoreductase domain protein [Planctopirus limnophila DSM 3776]|uniref:Oxidoreductase domain protein n=1 Tax=Planctopirus limnophila (strain ATCC 43296 / DSM 3776 / IFAM 1008 / Mu 290) TaxID=521674 RepID=D5SY30_PLAL2|nr:Gfo/Idh/MocA family oxidoreductase [Planctopirus limnophila]ADG69823.1 oxidoreductase domain protein [Planctopirus limnophila DSM 3776]
MNTPSSPLDRRDFLATTSLGLLAANSITHPTSAQEKPPAQSATATGQTNPKSSDRVRIGVMGLGRGMAHVQSALATPGVELAWICDVDEKRLNSGLKAIAAKQAQASATAVLPQTTDDFRRILDDRTVDALVIAAPNFWQAPATILACAAGKHVYVEKPGSHDPQEAIWMVAAARKHQRHVQMGNQRRSWPAIQEAISKLHEGIIGRLTYARCWYNNLRKPVGPQSPAAIPAGLNFDLWQGPVPRRDYVENLVHYQWHWFWDYGNGELGNNGIHALDLARWGLGGKQGERDQLQAVSYLGGHYHLGKTQESPDTGGCLFDYGTHGILWEGSSSHARRPDKLPFVEFYGEQGSLSIEGSGYRAFDMDGAEIAKNTGTGGDLIHFENFIEAIRGNQPLQAEIEEGQKSTMLCHLGNISWRTGQTLHARKITPPSAQPADESSPFVNSSTSSLSRADALWNSTPDINNLWTRPHYAPGFAPQV